MSKIKTYLFTVLVRVAGVVDTSLPEEEIRERLAETIAAEYGEPPEEILELREATEEEQQAAEIYKAMVGDGPTSLN